MRDRKERPQGIKHKIRDEKKQEKRVGLIITVAFLATVIAISGFAINSQLNKARDNQPAESISEPKAAIVDQLSLTYPSQAFVKNATSLLRRAGYSVDYYSGESVTVELYRNLPKHQYNILVLRTHSAAVSGDGREFSETPVSFFTSENYSGTRYVWEQLTDQIVAGILSPQNSYCFAVTPEFITSGLDGRFNGTLVIMMGCEGLNNAAMAEAFVERGAEAYVGWKGSVSACHTDTATLCLLQHLLIERKPLNLAVESTMEYVGPDEVYNAILQYYPLESGSHIIKNPFDG